MNVRFTSKLSNGVGKLGIITTLFFNTDKNRGKSCENGKNNKAECETKNEVEIENEAGINKKIVVVGTAHVSPKSVEEVLSVIEEYRPEAVAVELDYKRLMALQGKKQEVPIVEVIKRGEAHLLLFQILLSYFQRKIGEEYGVKPGDEMLAAIRKAEDIGADILLIDRDISITFKRFWSNLSIKEKLKIVYNLLKSLFEEEEIDIDEMLKEDVLELLVREFRDIAPSAAKILIDERDAYMAANLVEASKHYSSIVAVVGAGHKKGIESYLKNPSRIPPVNLLVEVKKGRNYGKILGYLVFVLIVTMFASVATTLSSRLLLKAFIYWFLINGVLSAVGAALAGGHPFSILTAFLIAWLTSINPTIAAGWFSGLVEAWVRKPTSKDVEELTNVGSLRELFRNKIFKVLLVAALTNLGSMAGTFIGIWYVYRITGIKIAEVLKVAVLKIFRII
ncbi:MAG: TraB family protein [Archaeoglobus sp.]|nr:MAG: TraB family protein [Archaeoglobus sp.]